MAYVIHQSHLCVFLQCPRKFHLLKEDGFPEILNDAARAGTLAHRAIALHPVDDIATIVEDTDKFVDKGYVVSRAKTYYETWEDRISPIFASEYRFRELVIPDGDVVGGIPVGGTIDCLTESMIVDWKCTSNAQAKRRGALNRDGGLRDLDMMTQSRFYCYWSLTSKSSPHYGRPTAAFRFWIIDVEGRTSSINIEYTTDQLQWWWDATVKPAYSLMSGGGPLWANDAYKWCENCEYTLYCKF
jgi:hypothetical protein